MVRRIVGPWKAVSSGLPNPNSKFHLMRLSDGTLALAYNHHDRARTNLFVALSKDGGDTWHLAARVEDGSGEEAGRHPFAQRAFSRLGAQLKAKKKKYVFFFFY